MGVCERFGRVDGMFGVEIQCYSRKHGKYLTSLLLCCRSGLLCCVSHLIPSFILTFPSPVSSLSFPSLHSPFFGLPLSLFLSRLFHPLLSFSFPSFYLPVLFNSRSFSASYRVLRFSSSVCVNAAAVGPFTT